MNATIQPLHKARLTLPDGKVVEVERIGKGRYTTAWANGHNVYLQTSEKDASKEILSTLNGAHIPKCRYVGSLTGPGAFGRLEMVPYRLYSMPKYRKVSARQTPDAWKQLRELVRLRELAQRKAMERRGIDFDGFDLNDCFRELLDNEARGLPRSLVSALHKLLDRARDYGEYVVEFRKANVAADRAGRLILLDPLFDMAEIRASQERARKRHLSRW